MPYEVMDPTLREHLSFSQLSLAASCGEAYRRRYIEGEVYDTWNVPALVGTAFHEAVLPFELTIEHRHPKAIDWDAGHRFLIARTKEVIRAIMDDKGISSEQLIHYGKQDLPFFFRTRIPEMACLYLRRRRYENEQLGFRWGLGSAEASIEVEILVEIGGKKFVGYIDQVFYDSSGRFVIRDLKTGKPKYGHAMQLEQYRLALKRARGIEADYGQLLYIHQKKKPVLEVVKWELDDRQVETATARLVHTVHDGVFLVNGPFTGACELCDYTPTCSYGQVGTR